jgi:hypothetical protein
LREPPLRPSRGIKCYQNANYVVCDVARLM